MNPQDTVTGFSLEEKDSGKNVTVTSLIQAVNAHCKNLLQGESFCDRTAWDEDRKNERIPKRFRSLISFAIEGESEGWYVHVGAMVAFGNRPYPGIYIDFGHAKLWSSEDAYALGMEAQKFLTAVRWN
ncbi:hypothetical protein [Edaphobacter dinghuensis]|uniref:Uncharacterized protein n=1 Tax=Edaphobacter dinghuensis TaxID=1560005 RepID=A0A917MB68_9BACT|nr:hypothetical protein [Edaphobacter dinghuensis]GGG86637.1 hypothetical protein GCM10011585_33250 [Edaphobacter dinghuensis]